MRYTVCSLMRILKIAVVVAALGVVWFFVRYGDWFDDAAQPLEPGTVAAIRRDTRPLSTIEPGQGEIEELRFLRPLVEGKRLVAAGEATHGTHEFFALKHRLFQYLASDMGFTVLAVQEPYQAGLAAGRYVADGTADPGQAVRQIGDWAWDTRESLALLRWMREHNQAHPSGPKLKFYGFDGQIPGGPRAGGEERRAANIKWLLDREGPQSKAFVWGDNSSVARLPGHMGDYLNRSFDGGVYIIGFDFNQGDFRARGPAGLKIYTVDPAPLGYYAYALSRVGSLEFFVDLASMRGDEALERWLMRPEWVRQYTDSYWFTRHFRKMNSAKAALPELYDGVMFSEHSWPLAPAGSAASQ
jgi:erythromycin esterase-like protein